MNHLKEYPVDAAGNMMSWVADHGFYRPAAWVSNEPQRLSLSLDGYSRSARTAKFVWADRRGRLWEMFASDMVVTLNNRTVEYGVVDGLWQVVKRGTNYGLVPCDEEEVEG